MTLPTDPMSEARALAERMSPGEWVTTSDEHYVSSVLELNSLVALVRNSDRRRANAAGIVAAVRAFRAICAPESVEALARVLQDADNSGEIEGADFVIADPDVSDWGAYLARAVLAHLARIAMEGGER